MINLKEIQEFKNYGKCVCLSNGIVEAYVTVDIGPRIIYFGYVGGNNIMCSNRNAFGPKEDDVFQNFYGKDKKWENLAGHRIWISPESYPETYYPDLTPVTYEITKDGAIFTPAVEIENGVAKSLELKMDADDANMQVIMRVKNISKATKKFSVWGLSVCEAGGTLVIPMNTNDTGLLSNRIVSVWPYTDMSDSRLYWGNKYITITQDKNKKNALKIGVDLNCGTVYYNLGEDIFCKRYDTEHPNAQYPDGGCSFETYTNESMIEIESLGELKDVAAGETAELTESWSLFKKPCDVDFRCDNSISQMLSKI